jgi:hypothetical protein
LRFTLNARQERSGDAEISISNVFENGRGAWKLYRNGVESASGDDERIARKADLTIERHADVMKLVAHRDATSAYSLIWT